MTRRTAILTLGLACAGAPAAAQDFFVPPSGFTVENPVLRRIWAMGMDSSEAPALAQVLLDSIGPRLTASPGMEAAQDWLLRTYASWHVAAHREQTGTWRAWRRGVTHIDLVAPRVRTLEGQMLAWSAGTPGGRPVRAPVLILPDVPDSTAFAAWLPSAPQRLRAHRGSRFVWRGHFCPRRMVWGGHSCPPFLTRPALIDLHPARPPTPP